MSKDQIERLGVNAVERFFLSMNWLFREQQISDYGIDAHAEPKNGDHPTGQLIALQIKSGKSFFRKRGGNYVFYGEARHLEYWTQHALPVFIVIYDPDEDVALWQKIDRQLVTHHTNERWSIDIPPGNVLDAAAEPYLRRGISNNPSSVRRFRIAVDLPLIRDLDARLKNEAGFLIIEEWINKSLNFREAKITFKVPSADPAYVIPTFLAMAGVEDVIERYFPWLECHYSRPVRNFAFEIDEHVFEIEINDIGAALLRAEEYYEQGAETPDFTEEYEHEDELNAPSDDFSDAALARALWKARDE